MPGTRLPSCCQSPVSRCQAGEVQVWPPVLVRVLSASQRVNRQISCRWVLPSDLKESLFNGECVNLPPFNAASTAERTGTILSSVRWASLETLPHYSIHICFFVFWGSLKLFFFCSGWESGLKNVMMTVKLRTGLQQIRRYGGWCSSVNFHRLLFLCVLSWGSMNCPDSDRSVQNAMWPSRKMAAATTWSVGTRTAKPSSAGSAWVHGSPMAQPGKHQLQPVIPGSVDVSKSHQSLRLDLDSIACTRRSSRCFAYENTS